MDRRVLLGLMSELELARIDLMEAKAMKIGENKTEKKRVKQLENRHLKRVTGTHERREAFKRIIPPDEDDETIETTEATEATPQRPEKTFRYISPYSSAIDNKESRKLLKSLENAVKQSHPDNDTIGNSTIMPVYTRRQPIATMFTGLIKNPLLLNKLN